MFRNKISRIRFSVARHDLVLFHLPRTVNDFCLSAISCNGAISISQVKHIVNLMSKVRCSEVKKRKLLGFHLDRR